MKLKRDLSRFIILFLGIFIFSSVSCKKEEEQKSTFDKIVGQWKGVEVYYEEFPPGQPPYNESENISAYNFEFKADGTFVMDSAGYDQEFLEWSVTNNDEFVWRYDANSFDVFDITVITDTQFHLEESGEYDSGNGVMVPYRDVIRLKK